MAYAALVSLEQTTDPILNHYRYSYISIDEREKITSIREHVICLISFFENCPEKANRFEGKIRDLANEAEDLLEYLMFNEFQLDWSVELSSVEFERRLKRVGEEIGSITRDVTDDRVPAAAAISSSRLAATTKTDVVMGLDEDLLAINCRLCGESSKLEVIPIVGMGGIGKTTLARYAYNHPLIMGYFDICAFTQVSQDYSAKEFLSNLLASVKKNEEEMSGEKYESGIAENEHNESGIAENEHNESGIAENEYSESEIVVKVYKSLKGRRYLIAMDDIWSTDVWDEVRNVFPDDNNGSRIMLTTRLSHVAAYASYGSPLHEMKFMDGHHSWDLLKQKVFTDGQDCPAELEDIGKEISRGCRGLPLAVVLIAGILSTVVRTRASWEEVMENVNSVVGQSEGILSLSYTHLPHHLKPCFLFMAAFPEDHSIHAARLVRLWVAEGFLKHQDGYKTLEEEAGEYLEDLVKRSLVLIKSRKSDGKIKKCSLHDLVREMCIRKAQEEKFLLSDGRVLPERVNDSRRISIANSDLDKISGPSIHSIMCFQTSLLRPSLASLVKFRLLRVLDINHIKLSKSALLPPQLFELFHLRYLALGFPNVVPAAISKLENLQTLIIRPWRRSGLYASLTEYLPLEIWRMPRLRNLVLTEFYMLPDPLSPMSPLENLHTLSGMASFVCSERILKMIPNLKKFGIFYFGNEEHHHLLHNLVNLQQLEKLKITSLSSWKGSYPAFPLALKKLSLVGGRIHWKKMSIVGSLPNLQVLKLKDYAYDGDTWETTDGEFPELKFLLIVGSILRDWITESDHFPSLECLALHDCPFLSRIPDCIGHIPTLELIEVDSKNKSLVESAKQIQDDQLSDYANDSLQVHCKTIDHCEGYATNAILPNTRRYKLHGSVSVCRFSQKYRQ